MIGGAWDKVKDTYRGLLPSAFGSPSGESVGTGRIHEERQGNRLW